MLPPPSLFPRLLLAAFLFSSAIPLLHAQSNFATPYTISTFAGLPGTLNSGHVDAKGTAARFSYPISVAVDGKGNVFVADEDSSDLRKITPAGVVTTLMDLYDGLGNPQGVATDAAGNVYVSNVSDDTIRKITPAGVKSIFSSNTTIGSTARLAQPRSLAVDKAGNVYVANSSNCTIVKITPAGVASVLAGSPTASGSADGTGQAARFNLPNGIAVAPNGTVYVADSQNSTIRKITPAGVVTTLAGTPGTYGATDGVGAAARFNNPSALAVDAGGNLILADTGTNTIRKITPAGVVTSLAGGTFGTANGKGAAASFYYPYGIALDASGNLYIADSLNHDIRKGTPPPAPPVITSSLTATATQGTLFSYQIVATGTPSSYSLAEAIPAGLTFSASTGLLTGTPTQGGTFTLKLGATNALGGTTANLTLTIPLKAQTITFPALASSKAGLTATLAATASSGLPVSYSVLSGSASIVGNSVTYTGAGKVQIAANQAGNSSYKPAPTVTRSVTVNQGTQTIASFKVIAARGFTSTPFAIVLPTASSGLPVTVTVKSGPAKLSGNMLTLTGTGAVTLVANQAGNASFPAAKEVSTSFVVSKGSQTITFPAVGVVAAKQKVTLKATASSGLAVVYTVASGSAKISGNVVTFGAAGTVRLTATQAGNIRYNAAPPVSINVKVK